MPTPRREDVRIQGPLRDGSTVRPSEAVPLRCHAITLVAPAHPMLPDVGRDRPCVIVIERGVEPRADPAEPTYRTVRSCNDRRDPFNSPLTGWSAPVRRLKRPVEHRRGAPPPFRPGTSANPLPQRRSAPAAALRDVSAHPRLRQHFASPRYATVADHCAPRTAKRGETSMGVAASAALSCPAAPSRSPTGYALSGTSAGASSNAVVPPASSPLRPSQVRGPTSSGGPCSRATRPDRTCDKGHGGRPSGISAPRRSPDTVRACADSGRRTLPLRSWSSSHFVSSPAVSRYRCAHASRVDASVVTVTAASERWSGTEPSELDVGALRSQCGTLCGSLLSAKRAGGHRR